MCLLHKLDSDDIPLPFAINPTPFLRLALRGGSAPRGGFHSLAVQPLQP